MKRFTILLSLCLCFWGSYSTGNAAIPGDIDNNGIIEIEDAMLGLQLLSDTPDNRVDVEVDINADGKIGMEEILFVMQTVSGIRWVIPDKLFLISTDYQGDVDGTYEVNSIISILVSAESAYGDIASCQVRVTSSSTGYDSGEMTAHKVDDSAYFMFSWDTTGLSPADDYEVLVTLTNVHNLTITKQATIKLTHNTPYRDQVLAEVDLSYPSPRMPLFFQRTYDVQLGTSAYHTSGEGMFGQIRWFCNYETNLKEAADGTVTIVIPNGKGQYYTPNGDDTYTPTLPGNTAQLTKDASGYSLRLKDGTIFRYHTDGRLAYQEDRYAYRTQMNYTGGKLTEIVDPSGATMSLEWQDNRVNRIIGPAGREISYQYDTEGRLSSVTNPEGEMTLYHYTASGGISQVDYPYGDSEFFEYYANGRLKSKWRNNNINKVTYAYSSVDSSYTITNARGFTTTYTYDGNGAVVQIEDPDGNITYLDRDSDQNITRIEDPLGRETSLEYDENGNITKITNADGGTTTMTYDPTFSQMTSVTDARGKTWIYTINSANGNIMDIEDPSSGHTSVSYGSFPNLPSRITFPSGSYRDYTYTPQGLATSISSPVGTIAFTYSVEGWPMSRTDQNGETVSWTYDIMGRLLSETEADNTVTTITYDAQGNISQIIDARGQSISYSYDLNHRPVSATFPDSTFEEYDYDVAGNLIEKLKRGGEQIFYQYNWRNQLTRLTFPEGLYDFTYDDVGNLKTAGDISFDYDALNHLISESSPRGILNFEYDAAGNRTDMTAPGGIDLSYTYNDLGLLEGIIGAGAVDLAQYEYDSGNRLTLRTLGNGVYSEYGYDAADRLLSIHHRKSDSSLLSQYVYTLDDVGNRLTMTTLEGTHSYSYDGKGQLLSVNYPGGSLAEYLYDDVGNRENVTGDDPAPGNYIANTLNQYTEVGPALDVGPHAKREFEYDPNGNLSKETQREESATFVWDGLDRLIQTEEHGYTISYSYDALGRRTSRTSSLTGTVQFVWDGWQCVAELDGTATPVATYTYGQRIDEVINMTRAGQTYWYTQDGLDSVTEITDDSESLIEQYIYKVFGMPVIKDGGGTEISASMIGNPYMFTGRRYEREAEQGSLALEEVVYEEPIFLGANVDNTVLGTTVWHYQATQEEVVNVQFDLMALDESVIETFSVTIDIGPAGTPSTHEIGDSNEFQDAGSGVVRVHSRSTDNGQVFQVSVGDSIEISLEEGDVVGNRWQTQDGVNGRGNTVIYYYRHRYYNPSIAQFLSNDPLLLATEYKYVNNAPTTLIDPLGLFALALSPVDVAPNLPGGACVDPCAPEDGPFTPWKPLYEENRTLETESKTEQSRTTNTSTREEKCDAYLVLETIDEVRTYSQATLVIYARGGILTSEGIETWGLWRLKERRVIRPWHLTDLSTSRFTDEIHVYHNPECDAPEPSFIQAARSEYARSDTVKKTKNGLKAFLIFPYENALVRADVPVYGIAAGENFKKWRLEYGHGRHPENWTIINESNYPQAKAFAPEEFAYPYDKIYTGTLGNWRTGLTNYTHGEHPTNLGDIYTLRLVVEGKDGSLIEDRVTLEVGRVVSNVYGGLVESPDGNAWLRVSEWALRDYFEVLSIKSVDTPISPMVDEQMKIASQAYLILPERIRMTRPAELSIAYEPENGDAVLICRFDPFSKRWLPLPGEPFVDTQNHIVTQSFVPDWAWDSLESESTFAVFSSSAFSTGIKPSEETRPDSAFLQVVMEDDPALVREDFEISTGSWRNLGGDVGATVEKVQIDDDSNNHCVRLTNTNAGGNFASVIHSEPYDAGRYPFISFRYRLQQDVKLNLLAKVNDRWFEVGLTDDPKDYVRVNMEGVGRLAGITDDDEWHLVHFNLYQMLRKSPYLQKASSLTVEKLVLADWDTRGYMLLGFGANAAGATAWIDDFSIAGPSVPSDRLVFDIEKPNTERSLYYLVDSSPSTVPAMETNTLKSGKIQLSDLRDGIWNLHVADYTDNGTPQSVRHVQFAVDTEPPTVLSVSPAAMSSSAQRIVKIDIQDNVSGIDPESIKLTVSGSQLGVHDSGVSFDEATGQLVIDTVAAGISLKHGNEISAQLLSLADFAGNTIEMSYKWSWQVNHLLDTDPPSHPMITWPISSAIHSADVLFHCKAEDNIGISAYAWEISKTSDTEPQKEKTSVGMKSFEGLSDGDWYLHVRAQDQAGNWSETRHTPITIDTRPQIELVVTSPEPQEMEARTFSSSEGMAVVHRINGADIGTTDENVLSLAYDVRKPGAYAGYWVPARGISVGDIGHLTLQLMGAEGGERLSVGMKDSTGQEAKVSLLQYLPLGAERQWVTLEIPLTDFNSDFRFGALENLSFIFEQREGCAAGQVYIRDVELVKRQSPLLVESFEKEGFQSPLGSSRYTFSDGRASISAAIIEKSVEDSKVLELTCELPEPEAYTGWALDLRELDMQSYDYLTLHITGERSLWTNARIYLSSQDRKGRVSVERFATREGDWQEVRVPLVEFSQQGIDISKLDELSISFERAETAGKVLIDDIVFSKWNDSESEAWVYAEEDKRLLDAKSQSKLLDLISRKAFDYFWEQAHPDTGMIQDHTGASYASMAGTGFGLAALCIGVENGWIEYEAAYQRVLLTLQMLFNIQNTSSEANEYGKDGFFYHFVDPLTLQRSPEAEISTIDTGLLLYGVIAAGEYFGNEAVQLADSIYQRVRWSSFITRSPKTEKPVLRMGWTPENGFLEYNWDFYTDEALLLSILAMGSPTFPVDRTLYQGWAREKGSYGDVKEFIYSYFGALFTYQYAHAWLNLKPLTDSMGTNWWENTRLATLANRQFCIDRGSVEGKAYSADMWGITSMDHQSQYVMHFGTEPNGAETAVHDGTIGTAAVLAALPFTHAEATEVIRNLHLNYPGLWGEFGFKSSLNLRDDWVSNKYFAIDLGLTLLALDSMHQKTIWQAVMDNPYIKRGLNKAGLTETTLLCHRSVEPQISE